MFSSTLFPGRAPDGCVTLTTFVGGARHPELAIGPERAILSATQADLVELLGVQGRPCFQVVQQWPRAIPQYTLGYAQRLQDMDDIERGNPGLYLTGSFRNGVAVGEVMTSGVLSAEAAMQALHPADGVPAGWAV